MIDRPILPAFERIGVARRYDGASHMGLIGFDGEAGSRYVRPELLRLVKQGTKINANDNLALAA